MKVIKIKKVCTLIFGGNEIRDYWLITDPERGLHCEVPCDLAYVEMAGGPEAYGEMILASREADRQEDLDADCAEWENK